jgi:hypothetical protein
VDYSWSLLDSTLSRAGGDFSLNKIKPGLYSIIFQRQDKKAFSGYFHYYQGDSLLPLGYVELKNTQNIQGSIKDTTAYPGVKRWLLHLVGTPFIDTVQDNGRFSFADIPAGFYNFKIGAPVQDTTPMFPFFGLIVNICGTTVVDRNDAAYFLWAADTLAVNNSDSTISIPWRTNAVTSNISFGPDTVKLTIDNYKIEYTSSTNP